MPYWLTQPPGALRRDGERDGQRHHRTSALHRRESKLVLHEQGHQQVERDVARLEGGYGRQPAPEPPIAQQAE